LLQQQYSFSKHIVKCFRRCLVKSRLLNVSADPYKSQVLKCFSSKSLVKTHFEIFQQIPWKKQARALSLILALISSLLEAAGRRVVDVVVVDGDWVVVDEFCNLSSSSLQIPWKKHSITFCLSLCLASLEREGRAVVDVVVVVVVTKVSVVGFV